MPGDRADLARAEAPPDGKELPSGRPPAEGRAWMTNLSAGGPAPPWGEAPLVGQAPDPGVVAPNHPAPPSLRPPPMADGAATSRAVLRLQASCFVG